MRQIARDLGVSPSLVSLVINGRWREHNIADETHRRVLQRVEELNYRPNRLAISLRRQKTETIGVLIPVLANFYEEILRGVQRALGNQFVLTLGVPDYDAETERRMVGAFLERQVDGLVVVPTGDPGLVPLLAEVQQRRVPLVLADRYFHEAHTHYVGSDHHALGEMAAEHLLAAGYRRLGCMTAGPITSSTMLGDRVAGFRGVAEQAGLAPCLVEQPRLLLHADRLKPAEHALDRMIDQFGLPVGVFVISTSLAEALFRVCRRRGLRVPEDVGILTVDQPPAADDLYETPLSTIRQQTQSIGETAGRYLSEMIEGKRPIDGAERKLLPASLVALRSTDFQRQASS